MTAEWYDLAQRLHADRTRQPAPRLVHSPWLRRPTPSRFGPGATVAACWSPPPPLTPRRSPPTTARR